MGWNTTKSEERIKRFIANAPTVETGVTLAKSARLSVFAKAAADTKRFPTGQATLIQGAHLYGVLLDFDELVLQDKRETEASHARVLQFLDLHYRVWDALVEEDDAIRVDYHGPRVHVVVSDPEGNAAEQIRQAMSLAEKLEAAAKRVAAIHGFPARVRFGIDQGPCLAMTTGRSHEQDILFLGSPANHAAKLAAGDRLHGIFLTESAQQKLKISPASDSAAQLRAIVASASQQYRFAKFDAAVGRIEMDRAPLTSFQFRRVSPPLSGVKFSDLTPANSIRMGMGSIFADIDGYTRYVDAAILGGEAAIRNAVRDIHVLREELNSVAKEDFGGKRVRFIGDCIQCVLTEGSRLTDDGPKTVKESVYCASGMQSSFLLAQKMLKSIDKLGLAIGVEYGPVPLTRIGNRGLESVRCAASLAVTNSERLQQAIQGSGISLGPNALAQGDDAIRKYFQRPTKLPNYSDAATYFGTVSSPAVQIMRQDVTARPHAKF